MDPGFDVILRDEPVPTTGPVDTTTGIIVGKFAKGPLDPTILSGPDKLSKKFGDLATSDAQSAAEEFFAEGGSRLIIKRTVGEDAAVATHVFKDNAAADTLAMDARDPSDEDEYQGTITVDGGTFMVIVEDLDDNPVEVAGPFASKAEAVAWSQESEYVRLRSLAPNTLPVASAHQPLVGGDSDHAAVDDDAYIASFNDVSKYVGPGQIAVPGVTSVAVQSAVLAHCLQTNRRAVLDSPNSGNVATLKAAAAALRPLAGSRYGAMFGPWDVVPGRLANTTKVVPPSGRIMGTIARVQAPTNNPGLAAAGDDAISRRVIRTTFTFTDDEYTELNVAGVNMSRTLYDSDVQTYGFRTLVDPEQDERWVEFNGSRVVMHATAITNTILKTFAFDNIDGNGHVFSELEGEVTGLLLPLYNKGALYGSSPREAFRVTAGRSVNTPERVKARELRVVFGVKTSPFAEHVVAEVVRRMVTEEV